MTSFYLILINFNCLSKPTIKVILKSFMSGSVLTNICPETFPQIITEASLAEFIFSKVPCFQYILLNTFRMKYEKYPARHVILTRFR